MKQKMKKLIRIGIHLFAIPLFLISCTNDSSEIELSETQKLKDSFSLENFEDDFVKNNLVVNWTDYNLAKENDSVPLTYEFNTSFKVNNSLDNGKQKLHVKYKLLASKNDSEQWDFEIIKFLCDDSEPINNISYFSTSLFSGSVYFYNLKGENTKIKVYDTGTLIDELLIKDLEKTNPLARYPENTTSCGACWFFVRTEHYTDWYKGGGSGSFVYTHSVLNYVSYEYIYIGGTSAPTEYHNHYDAPHGGGGGGSNTNNHENEIIFEYDENLVYYNDGDKPIYENDNKCNGLNQLWTYSQNSGDEYAAVLTTDGAILITQQLNTTGGGISGIYEFNGITYYQYPTSQGAPSRAYQGQLESAGRYFIPIVATIHSHTPCLNDGTDGITNNTINDDQSFALHYPNINHYIIGCNAIGQFNGNSYHAFNIQTGNLSTTCNNIN